MAKQYVIELCPWGPHNTNSARIVAAKNTCFHIFQSVFSNGLVPLYDLFNVPADTGYPPPLPGTLVSFFGVWKRFCCNPQPGTKTAAVYRKDLFPETTVFSNSNRSVKFHHEHANWTSRFSMSNVLIVSPFWLLCLFRIYCVRGFVAHSPPRDTVRYPKDLLTWDSQAQKRDSIGTTGAVYLAARKYDLSVTLKGVWHCFRDRRSDFGTSHGPVVTVWS